MKKMIILAVLMVAGLFFTNFGTTLLNAQTGASTIAADYPFCTKGGKGFCAPSLETGGFRCARANGREKDCG